MWWNFNKIHCGNSAKQASRPTAYFSPPNTLIPLFYYFLYAWTYKKLSCKGESYWFSFWQDPNKQANIQTNLL